MPDPRLIVALDFSDAKAALAFAHRLNPEQCRLKVGLELYTAAGPLFIESLMHLGFGIFLDLKFHDIPNTVERAVRVASSLGVWMINVHALGGRRMLEASRAALEGVHQPPKLVAVTLLTSMDTATLAEVGLQGSISQNVLKLAKMVDECGLDGIVCSALEAPALRNTLRSQFCLVTPGIRPLGSIPDDQSRIVTPAEAIALGADYLVIGRPISRAREPDEVIKGILMELGT